MSGVKQPSMTGLRFPTSPKPQTQRWTVQDMPEHRGDCLRTSIAILLGLDRDAVPHFADMPDWWSVMRGFLAERGYTFWDVPATQIMTGRRTLPDHGYIIASGVTERSAAHWRSEEPWALAMREALVEGGTGLIHHAIVMKHDLMGFIDPYPDGNGLRAITHFTFVFQGEPEYA